MIKKLFLLCLLFISNLSALEYDATILELEAKLFPKMILLSDTLHKKNGTLSIYIITQEIDIKSAEYFQDLILTNYPKKISGKKIEVSIKEFTKFKKNPDAIIVLDHSEERLTKIALWANSNKIISLAYDPYYMSYGLLASLYIGKTIKPYINSTTMKKYNFSFNPYLLKLSKFY